MTRPVRLLCLLLCSTATLVLLTACDTGGGEIFSGGNGSSSSSSPSPAPASAPAPAPSPSTVSQLAGTYTGSLSATLSTPIGNFSETDSITVVIGTDGSFTVTSASGIGGSGTLNGTSFSDSTSGTVSSSGFTCSGTVSVSGSASGNTISGNVSGSGLTCNGLAVTLSGSFTASR